MRNGGPRSRQSHSAAQGAPARARLRLALALFLLASLGLGGCPKAPLNLPPPEDAVEGGSYRIGPGDQLEIRVWENAQLNVVVPVRNDGMISVPLLDDVEAKGHTALELKEILTEALKKYVRSPDVTVIVAASGSKQVSIVGEVAQPGRISLAIDMRVLDAIAAVGGFAPFADRSAVRVLRPSGSDLAEYTFDYEAYVDGDVPEANFLLKPGDTIVVPD